MTTPSAPLLQQSQDKVIYQAGQNTFIGITTVTLDSTGQIGVTHRRGKTTEEFKGSLSLALRRKVNAALVHALKSPAKADDYRPTTDEARIQVEIVTRGKTQHLIFWQNQATQNKSLQRVMTAFQAAAKAVSKGKVTY